MSLLEDAAKTRVDFGTAYIEQNPMTGDWFVFGQKDSHAPYICEDKSDAKKLAKTVDHYNKTGERKRF